MSDEHFVGLLNPLKKAVWKSFKNFKNFFPENLGAVSDEHGERFHQQSSTMEKRYQGKWSSNIVGDYCWTKKRDVPDAMPKNRYLSLPTLVPQVRYAILARCAQLPRYASMDRHSPPLRSAIVACCAQLPRYA
ncbi:hypothetical protein ACJJTC_007272 [Scirpophaga incertulas]